jgi:hypothetical protein
MGSPLQSGSMAGDDTHSFSTQPDRASTASDIELRPLVPNAASAAQHDETPERITDLRNATHTAATPDDINEPSWKRGASLQSPTLGLRTKDSSVIKRLVFDSWVCETVVMILSMGCLAAIALVVNAFDGQAIPQFTAGLTLNTIISVLSTTARSGMIFVVSASIGQLKWCWLGRPGRRLLDIQAMDDASRGPWGAITMLSSLTGGTMAAFGAVITVLMVAFGPFLQQLLAYPLHEVKQQQLFALAPRNLNYTNFYAGEGLNMDFFEVLEAGTWSTPKPLEPTCPTARCEWDTFSSVGWCSKCEDRTQSAVLSDCNISQYFQNLSLPAVSCTVDLGNGGNISLAEQPSNYTLYAVSYPAVRVAEESLQLVADGAWMLSNNDQSNEFDTELIKVDPVFLGVTYPLLVFDYVRTSLYEDNEDDLLPIHIEEASQCILSICEREFTVTAMDGSINSTPSSPNYGNLFLDCGSPPFRQSCWQPDGQNATPVDEVEDTYVDRSRRAFCPVDDFASDIAEYLVGNATVVLFSGEDGVYVSDEEFHGSKIVGNRTARGIEKRLENIATALTNYGLEKTNETVRGRAYAEETYVKVRWWWILLPTLLQLSTLILFITTVVYSHRNGVPIWKSSVLAIVYHGVEDLDGRKDLGAERLSGMDAVARRDKVQFSRSADGIHHLYGRSHR